MISMEVVWIVKNQTSPKSRKRKYTSANRASTLRKPSLSLDAAKHVRKYTHRESMK